MKKEAKKGMKLEEVTKENVKSSVYGCRNCLWASAECVKQAKYKPRVADGKASCEAYTYYD